MEEQQYENNNFPMDKTPGEILEEKREKEKAKKALLLSVSQEGLALKTKSMSKDATKEDVEAYRNFFGKLLIDNAWNLNKEERNAINRTVMLGDNQDEEDRSFDIREEAHNQDMASILGVPEEYLDDYMNAHYNSERHGNELPDIDCDCYINYVDESSSADELISTDKQPFLDGEFVPTDEPMPFDSDKPIEGQIGFKM
jgi:hypothetical protein